MNISGIRNRRAPQEKTKLAHCTLTFAKNRHVTLEPIVIEDVAYLRIAKNSDNLFDAVYSRAAEYLRTHIGCASVVSTDLQPPDEAQLRSNDLVVLTVGTIHDRHKVLAPGNELCIAYRFKLLTGPDDYGRIHYCSSKDTDLGPIVFSSYTPPLWEHGFAFA